MANVSKFVFIANDNKNPKDFIELEKIIPQFISNNKQARFFYNF